MVHTLYITVSIYGTDMKLNFTCMSFKAYKNQIFLTFQYEVNRLMEARVNAENETEGTC